MTKRGEIAPACAGPKGEAGDGQIQSPPVVEARTGLGLTPSPGRVWDTLHFAVHQGLRNPPPLARIWGGPSLKQVCSWGGDHPFTLSRIGVIYRQGRLNGSATYVPRYARGLANVSAGRLHSATARALLCHLPRRWRQRTGQIPVPCVVGLLFFLTGQICRRDGCHTVHGVSSQVDVDRTGRAHLPSIEAQAVAYCEPPAHPRINTVPKGLLEERYHLHIGSARETSSPTLRGIWYQQMGKLSRGLSRLDHSNISDRPPTYSLPSRLSAFPSKNFAHTLCNTNYTNIAIARAAVLSSV